MKKIILLASLALGAMSASAQAVEQPKFFDNWSITLDGGVTTPMHNHPFFGDMRGVVGLEVAKQVTPVFGVGVEGQFGVNTSSWFGGETSKTAFDNSYVGAFGSVDLFNLFGGYNCETRPFTIEAVLGAGWIHYYMNGAGDYNDFGTKLGLNFNFNVSDKVTIALKPSVLYNMTGAGVEQSSAAYNINAAAFNFEAGVTYRFGGRKFACVTPFNQAQIDALNGQINDLRSQLDAAVSKNTALENKANGLANELAACLNRPKEVVKEVSNNLNSVRYVFYKVGSSVITPDQQPNVEMVASYLKSHKDAKVVIKGYASPEGPLELNKKLAEARALSVKNALINKYKIAADRIVAEGEGIGEMFTEQSWNRVSICTLEESK